VAQALERASAAFSNTGEASSPADIEVEVDVEATSRRLCAIATFGPRLRWQRSCTRRCLPARTEPRGAAFDLHCHGHKSVTKRADGSTEERVRA
jgi:hypothetical protein